MEVLSLGRTTILSGYPDLNTKYTYSRAENEAIDLQFFPLKLLFLQVNKKSGLELLQIKKRDNKDAEIARVKKVLIDNLYCAACPKVGHDEIALGLSSGVIKLLNYKSSEFTLIFPAESPRNSVIFLDFNGSNEYLSSVRENGMITLYGLKTKIKLETLNFDNNCTLSRFHPSKKFHMAVASSNGSVFVYDIQTKRQVFQSLDCHGAPCKDICMSSTHPDIMLSVGYDCIMNVFDTRKKIQPQQIRYRHPLSTIASSDCGNYVCVGNLKGELISYDMRNTKTYINSTEVHDCAVVRVAFAPPVNSSNESFLNLSQENMGSNFEQPKPVENKQGRRDSFCDFLEYHSYKLKAPNNFDKCDSYDWELLGRRNSDFSTDHRISNVNGLSNDSRLSVDNISDRHPEDMVSINKISLESNVKKNNHAETAERRLNYIAEEKEEDTRFSGNNQILHPSKGECCEKENILNLSNKDLEGFMNLPDDRNSTPKNCKHLNEIEAPPNISNVGAQELLAELQKMRSEMDSKFKKLESEIKFNLECNKWSIFTQNFNLWRKQIDISEEIRDSVECLAQSDPFINEFLRLQKENEQLKKSLLEFNKSK